MKRMISFVFVLFSALILSGVLIASLTFAQVDMSSIDDPDEAKAEIEKLEQEIENLQSRKNLNSQQKQQTLQEIENLESRIHDLNADINYLEQETSSVEQNLTSKDQEIQSTKEEITSLEQSITENKQSIARILKEMYQRSAFQNEVSMTVAQGTFAEALSELEYSNTLQSDLQHRLDDLQSQQQELAQKQERLNQERSNLASTKSQLEQKQVEIASLRNQVSHQAQASRSQAQQLDQTIDRLERNEQDKSQEMQEMERFYKELIQKQAQEQLASANSPLGSIVWPSTSSRCTQGYGMTRYAATGAYGGAIHNGIDIGGSGNPVKAIADGTVIGRSNYVCGNGGYSSCGGGWGNWIALRHDSGHVSLYAHLSGRPRYGTGQRVDQGTSIGNIGNSGFSTGPHLHLSIYTSFGLTSSGNPAYAPKNTLNPERYYNASCWR